MRSSAPEGQHAPRAKQAPHPGSSGATAGPAGAQPSSHPSPSSRNQASSPQVASSGQRGSQPSSSQRGSPALLPQSSRVSSQQRSTLLHTPVRTQQRGSSSQGQAPSSQRPTVQVLQNSGQKATQNSVVKSHSRSQNSQILSKQSHGTPSPSVKGAPASVSQGISNKVSSGGAKAPSSANPANFGEYDDQEWDVGVGHLIIDLDADIAQADRGRMSGAPSTASSHQQQGGSGGSSSQAILEDKASIPKLKIKRTKPTKTSEAKHEIVKTDPASPSALNLPQGERNSPAMQTQQHNGGTASSVATTTVKGEPITNNPRTPTCSRTSHKKEKRRLEINGSSSPPPSSSSIAPLNSNSSSSNTSSRGMASHLTPNGPAIPPPIKSEPRPSPTATNSSPVSSRKEHTTQVIPQSSVHPHIVPKQIQHQQFIIQQKQPSAQRPSEVQQQASSLQSQSMQVSQSNHQSQPQSQNQIAQQSQQDLPQSPSSKKLKTEDEKKDACVGTSVATITEPDCLGPCEPGSSVTLEGIVWHETEGGVLVVNVTWRGKTYVGTLLDCTKHDWAPPRFCDSPSSDLEARTPKGRAKRGRTSAASNASTNTPTTELSIAETRSGKLRNASAKNRRGGTSTPTFNPQSSPGKVETGGIKRKGKDADINNTPDPKNIKRARSSSRGTPTNNGNSCSPPPTEVQQPSPSQQPQESQQDAQQPRTPQRTASPVLAQQQQQQQQQQPPPPPASSQPQTPQPVPIQWIECPEPNCSKKFKHANGLSYHQIHAHSNSLNDEATPAPEAKYDGDIEETARRSPLPVTETPADANSKDLVKPSVVRPPLISPVSIPVTTASSEASENAAVVPYLPAISAQSNSVQVQITQSQPVYIYGGNDINLQQRQVSISTSIGTTTVTNTIMRHPAGPNSSQQAQTPPTMGPTVPPVPLLNSQNQEIQALPQQNSPHHQQLPQQAQSQQIQSPMIIDSRPPIPSLARPAPQQPPPPPPPSLPPPPQPQPQPQQQQQLLQQQPQHTQSPQQIQQQPLPDSNSMSSPILVSQQVQTPTRPIQPSQQSSPSFHAKQSPVLQPPQQIQHPIRVELKPEIVSRVPQDHIVPPVVRPPPPPVTSLNGPSEPIALSTQNIMNIQPVSTIPQGTPLSSLPGNALSSLKSKGIITPEAERANGKPKDSVNGLSPKQEEDLPDREDARSPAYSDISDANDSAPVMDGDVDSKDFKEDKKTDPLVGQPPYAYGLYFGGFGQPPHSYLMPPLQPSNLPLKQPDLKEKQLDKEKKDGIPGPVNNDFIKYPPQYLYQYPHLYPGNYPDPYLRDPVYKEMVDKFKLESKECLTIEDLDKGPTDLSRSSQTSNNASDRGPLNLKETKCDNTPLNKEPSDIKNQFTEKRPPHDGMPPYRYSSPYESRVPIVSSHIDKISEAKQGVCQIKPSVTHPSSLASPRVASTPPNNCNKDEKSEKRPEAKCEGVKPTMETTGPPPPPTSSSYYSPFHYGHLPFDPYRPQIVPPMPLPAGFPPSYLPSHSPGIAGLRYPLGVPPSGPEDLSRSGAGASILPPPGLYSASHKMAELQERAQKSPTCAPQSILANKGSSPLTLTAKESLGVAGLPLPPPPPPHNLPPLSSPSPSFSASSTVSSSSASSLHGPLSSSGERKTPPVAAAVAAAAAAAAAARLPPHQSLPDGYPYSILSAQFPPTHFAALGMNQPVLPAVGVVGSGQPPSAMGAGPLPK